MQVRVVHSGSLHLPLRLKAFAIVQDDKNQITDWLPDELREQSSERRSRMIVDLKGSTVVSYVFQSTTVRPPASLAMCRLDCSTRAAFWCPVPPITSPSQTAARISCVVPPRLLWSHVKQPDTPGPTMTMASSSNQRSRTGTTAQQAL